MNPSRCFILATTAAIVVASARPAAAWWFVEHAEIGTAGYRAACKRIAEELPDPAAAGAAEVHERYQIACDNLAVTAKLYGQAAALAGDRIDRPEDFLSAAGGWKTASRRHYLFLQLVDVEHFHPQSIRRWSRYHREAVEMALEASQTRGLEAIERYQLAFYRNAYSDHFLQDSFAAGHMGFNRAGSSIAATTVYHRIWNRRGRTVRDRAGRSWTTYGDGFLSAERNAEGKRHVIEASTLAAYGLVATFVHGTRNYEHELEVWRAMPFLIEAPTLPTLTESILGEDEDHEELLAEELYPTEAINWPARTDKVVDFWVLASSQSPRLSRPAVAGMIGFDIALPLISRVYLALGSTIPYGNNRAQGAGRIELHRQLALTFDGLLTHQLSLGITGFVRDDLTGSVHGGYQVTFELGLNLVKLQVGPSLTLHDRDVGYFAAVGYGRPFGASGGGLR